MDTAVINTEQKANLSFEKSNVLLQNAHHLLMVHMAVQLATDLCNTNSCLFFHTDHMLSLNIPGVGL